MIKSLEEIRCIKKAISITLQGFEYAQEIYDQMSTEKALAIELERFLKIKGDRHIAFSPIVACGIHSTYPHHEPREIKLNKKYFLIDLGSKYCGYCADLTRVFFWGKMPPLFNKIYSTVQKAHEKAFKSVKSGVSAKSVDKAARDVVEKAGLGKHFVHGTGHGVGLSVHEPPFLNRYNEERLEEGMVLTLEPAIYLPGKFGVRIEDMVCVKEKGEWL
jgi:Xaa-Pro aminopeptidase